MTEFAVQPFGGVVEKQTNFGREMPPLRMHDVNRGGRGLVFDENGLQSASRDMRFRLVGPDAGKPQAIERGVHRRVGSVHHQAGLDGYGSDPVQKVERPSVGNRCNRRARDYTVTKEIAGRFWYAVSRNVRRTRTDDTAYLPDADRPQRRVGKLSDPDAEIEPFIHQRDNPVEQQQANIDLRILTEKAFHEGQYVKSPKHCWRRDVDPTAGLNPLA